MKSMDYLRELDIRQLVTIIESADGEPQVLRDMILEGDAIDMIACILNKAPATTSWKDVDKILQELKDAGMDALHDALFEAIYGVDTPSAPKG